MTSPRPRAGRGAVRAALGVLPGVKAFRRLAEHVIRATRLLDRQVAVQAQLVLIQSELLATAVKSSPRYDDPKRLTRFEAQVYSQDGEDGILAEIFARIGTTNRVFAEFGVGDGLENNTTYLLSKHWTGFWFDCDEQSLRAIRERFGREIAERRLRVTEALATREGAAALIEAAGVPREPDLLSLDIDQNTSHLWRGLTGLRPRVAVVEYNASIPPTDEWEVEYEPTRAWNRSLYFGASLKTLERIGAGLGYALVGCSLSGVNAFFVRDDLVGDAFARPFTAENHYEPPRYHIIRQWGHSRFYGRSRLLTDAEPS